MNFSKTKNNLLTLFTYVFTVIMMIPFIWMVILAFKSNTEILTDPLSLPDALSFDNFRRAIETIDFPLIYTNTFIITVVTMLIEIPITFLSAFALSRLEYKNEKISRATYLFFIAGQAIPPFILLFPIYRITIMTGMENTYLSLIIPYLATSIGFNTLLFTGFLRSFPREIEEAALLDGASLFQLIWQVVFPIVKPIIVTVLIFNVIYVWNEYPFAVTLISDSSKMTIPMAVSLFQGRFNIDYGAIVAASLLLLIPQLIFYAIFQKDIIGGMTDGAIKG